LIPLETGRGESLDGFISPARKTSEFITITEYFRTVVVGRFRWTKRLFANLKLFLASQLLPLTLDSLIFFPVIFPN
jgi:hypothetical protein